MTSYVYLLLACAVVLVAYMLDLLGKRIRVPSVLLMLFFGIGLRALANYMWLDIPPLGNSLPILGTVGLILIVLEGGLEVELARDKIPLVKRAFWAALVPMLLYMAGIALFLYYFFDQAPLVCLLNAVPLSVISSAIAISSVQHRSRPVKEFVIFESSFSDILGVMAFNFLAFRDVIDAYSVMEFVGEVVAVAALSAVGCLLLGFVLERINSRVKFIPILTLLIGVYAAAKIMHLSPLLLILSFGIFLNNTHIFVQGRLKRYFHAGQIDREIGSFKSLTTELTFVIRAIFFVLFGFSTDLELLMEPQSLYIASGIVAVILLLRIGYLLLAVRKSIFPVAFVMPRGLITVLLLLSIPASKRIGGFGEIVCLWSILLSCLLMMLGLLFFKDPNAQGKEGV